MQPCAPVQALLDVLAGRIASPPQLDAADWEVFLAEASRHGVSALAAHALRHGECAPAHVVEVLERHLLRNRMRNLRLYARLSDLLAELALAGIDVIVLKGAHLARAVYEDAALRAMSDADLLVRERDLDRTAQTMKALGWHGSPPLPEGGHQLPAFEWQGVQVDVHWSIEDSEAPFAIDMDGLWRRATTLNFGRAQALVLAPEDLLLHLCMHTAYGHGWRQFDGGLRHIADIDIVVRHHSASFDWDGFIARAQAWRVDRCVWLALVVARDLLGAPLPERVLSRLVPPSAGAAALAHDAMVLAMGAHYDDLVRRVPVLSQTSMDKRWRRLPAMRRWRELLLPPAATLARSHPRLAKQPMLARMARWKDLATDLARVVLDRDDRLLWQRERRRHSMLRWLEATDRIS